MAKNKRELLRLIAKTQYHIVIAIESLSKIEDGGIQLPPGAEDDVKQILTKLQDCLGETEPHNRSGLSLEELISVVEEYYSINIGTPEQN